MKNLKLFKKNLVLFGVNSFILITTGIMVYIASFNLPMFKIKEMSTLYFFILIFILSAHQNFRLLKKLSKQYMED